MSNEGNKPIGERAAILETRTDEVELEIKVIRDELKEITKKLDELLHLKSKGMGALGLIGLVVGSGLLGLITVVVEFFSKPHL